MKDIILLYLDGPIALIELALNVQEYYLNHNSLFFYDVFMDNISSMQRAHQVEVYNIGIEMIKKTSNS